ncbi:DUF1877 family protein [Actinoplanes sp. Pm04-4]|uniref:DUF1877 family protein n=1 Tax=Paractinoplanes pyxinae TaxID=2997416 RepID=A0ABT4B1U3_9ACTN|nr:DUF1877 family protein [Actinoplanes pyxinae]MCY1139588.1 DUF1877 family protein [Actinoplanes pyxinae]
MTADQEAALMATRDDAEVRDLIDDIEMGDWAGEPLDCETDKAWDAIHRCLSDGTLGCGRHLSPLDMAVLGGLQHHEGEDYVVAYLRDGEVAEVAASLAVVDREWMRRRYDRIDATEYQAELSDEDFDYTWHWFTQVRTFYLKAAAAGRAVIFTVDQ